MAIPFCKRSFISELLARVRFLHIQPVAAVFPSAAERRPSEFLDRRSRDVANYCRQGVAMMKEDYLEKKFLQKAPPAPPAPRIPADPAESAELIRAFIAVRNPQMRKAILALVENLAWPAS